MIWMTVFFNIVTVLCALWLMGSPKQPRMARVIMAVLACGAVTNVVGLIWLGYIKVWPGELISDGGLALLLAWCVYTHEKFGKSADKIDRKEK